MCDSTLHQVIEIVNDSYVLARDVTGVSHQVSLLAFDGGTPAIGTWLIVHSGYAIDRIDDCNAKAVLTELRRAGVINATPARHPTL